MPFNQETATMYRSVMILLSGVLCACCAGCGKPSASLTATPKAGSSKAVLTLDTKHIRGIGGLIVWNGTTGEYLWAIARVVGPEPNTLYVETRYGSVPRLMEQLYPADNEAPAVPKAGDIVGVYVDYGYDEGFAACAGVWTFVFEVQSDGGWIPVDPAKVLRKPDTTYTSVEEAATPAG